MKDLRMWVNDLDMWGCDTIGFAADQGICPYSGQDCCFWSGGCEFSPCIMAMDPPTADHEMSKTYGDNA